MSIEAIILAGGLGTRLRSVIHDVPKPMAPVNGKPFLYYLLNYLHSEGIKRVILSVGYKHDVISSFFGSHFKSMDLVYAIEEQPMGTGGAVKLALSQSSEESVFILNGDTFFPVSLTGLREKHYQLGAEITLALKKVENNDRYGSVCLGADLFIESFKEKSASAETLINGGIYLLNKKSFLDNVPGDRFSFEKDYLEKVVSTHCLGGCIFDTYFLDIGVPDSLQKANDDFGSLIT
jgi:D-glycero-alpha-D-manno-heptose 1-phosphate guanylyltransferase